MLFYDMNKDIPKLIMTNLVGTAIILLIVVKLSTGLECWKQVCYRRDSKWSCYYKNAGIKEECGEDRFCYESSSEYNGEVISQVRACRSPESEVAKEIREKGEAKDDDSWYCNKPLCNNQTTLPEKYDVLLPSGTPYG